VRQPLFRAVSITRCGQPLSGVTRTLPPIWSMNWLFNLSARVTLNRMFCVRHEAHCYIARIAGMDWRRCLWI